MRDLVIDSFAGGGGASLGIRLALGRDPDIAINHDGEALTMHLANHPDTVHLRHDVWKVNPIKATGERPVGLLWASPDCKHHSRAKGSKPKEKRIRDLAWVVVRWAKSVRPRIICLENVMEFAEWGPLQDDGSPCPKRKGQTFADFVARLERLGYRVEYRRLRASDLGTPTIRERLFLVARCDGKPIIWPAATHGDPASAAVQRGEKLPFRAAAECIDWSIPCPSIFLTKDEARAAGCNRPLADATMRRIAMGVKRYVIEAAKPFIVSLTHQGGDRVESTDDPLRTMTCANRGERAVVSPVMTYAQQGGANRDPAEPLHTITASRKDQNAIVAPYLVPRYGERPGQEPRTFPIDQPGPTVVPTGNGGSLASVFLAQQNGGMVGRGADEPFSTFVGKGCTQTPVACHLLNMKGSERQSLPADGPMPTMTAQGSHVSSVGASLVAYYGSEADGQGVDEPLRTATAKARFGLTDVRGAEAPLLTPEQLQRAQQVADFLREHGCWKGDGLVIVHSYIVVDIGLRMLTPRELARGQGFPDTYILDPLHNGKPLSRTSQTRMIGNSVCPQVAAAIVYAQVVLAEQVREPPPIYRAWGASLKERLIARQREASIVQGNLFGEAA